MPGIEEGMRAFARVLMAVLLVTLAACGKAAVPNAPLEIPDMGFPAFLDLAPADAAAADAGG